MNNRSVLIILVLIAFSFLITGCSVIGSLEKTGCKLLPAGNTKDHCWQDAAVRLSMPSICYFIKGYKFGVVDNSPPMTKCFMRIAEKDRDINICEHIVEGHPNGYTKIDCYWAAAIAAKSYGYCDYIEENQSRGFGMEMKSREACYAAVANRPAYCADSSDKQSSEKLNCLSATAIDMVDVTVCEDAGTSKDKQLCLANAIEGIQTKMINDSKIFWRGEQCKQFNDPNLKYSCAIWATAAFDYSYTCDYILETQFNELCKLVAQFTKTIPSKYTDEEKTKAVTECNKFSIPEFKGFCLITFGHELELTASNEGAGEDRDKMEMDAIEFYYNGCAILDEKDKNLPAEATFVCVFSPLNLVQKKFCSEYKDTDLKDYCYTLDAMHTGDCSNVVSSEHRSDCKDSAIPYFKASEKICAKYKTDATKYSECQEDYTTGFFMQQLGVRMPETMKKFMKGK